MIGEIISHYKITEKLGEGGMGVVYKAQDTKLKRTVALKFLPHGLQAHEPERVRFLQEAQAAAALNHPNICTVYDISQEGDDQFIVMEYVDGKNLSEMLPIQRTQTAIDYAIQIGEALHEAHSKGIVHRDIKTDNIMVNAKNQVKVMDFGLAKLKGSLKLTKTSSTVGTLAYMAPEQIEGGEVDARSDIFSFGVVLYEMLTGHTPFRGEHEAAMVYSIVNEEPTSVQKYLPEVSSELVHILNRALEKDPEDRYQFVHEMVIDLRRMKKETSRVHHKALDRSRDESGRPGLLQPSEPLQPGLSWIRMAPRKTKWAVAGAIMIVLCVIGWLIFNPSLQRVAFKVGRSSQLTSEPGIKLDVAISPDGKMIAYTAYFKGTLRLHVKQVTGGRTLCLTEGIPGYQRCRQWSANGSEIVFSSFPSGEQYVVPAFGGTPRKLVRGVLSPDGKRTATVVGDTIYTQPIDGGKAGRIAVVSEPHSLCWSPDGSLVACVSGNPVYLSSIATANIAPSSIYVMSASSGSVARVTDNTSLSVSPAWTNDSRHLLFVSNRDGPRDIYCCAISPSGQPIGLPERLTTGLNVYTISLSSDSKMLAYSVLTGSANIWSIRIPETKWVSVKEATQVTTGNQVIESMGISPDGQWLAYDSNREGNQHIFKMLLKGGDPIQLTRNPWDDFQPNWSPDGLMIAFHSFRNGKRDIFVMPNDGSQLQQLTHDPAQNYVPDWSPDGNHLVFFSDKSGQEEIYVISRQPGKIEWDAPRQITFDGGIEPRWSPDGMWIAYIRGGLVTLSPTGSTGGGLCVISPKGDKQRVLVSTGNPSILPDPVFPEWSRDGRTIYYKAVDGSQRSSFWAVPLSGGKPQLLVKFDDPAIQSNRVEFSTDGKRFYFIINNSECDVWKIELMVEK